MRNDTVLISVRPWILAAALAAMAIGLLPGLASGGATGTKTAKSVYGYPYPDAPDCPESGNSSVGCVVDKWSFFQGQCTSWVAYRLNQRSKLAFKNDYKGQHFGSALNWGNAAKRAKIAVNGTPAVGAVAWYSSGHVGYVEKTSPKVVISEMNFDFHNGFRTREIRPGSHWPTAFIHMKDLTSSPPPPPSATTQPPPTLPAPPPPKGPSNTLSNDGRLLAAKNEYLRSSDGRYRFVMQQDSNLVLYGPSGRALWASNTVGRGAKEARMQGDGNLVVYDGKAKPIWASNTARHYHATLVVQNDGNVVIYEGKTPLWATGTDGRT